MGAAGASDVAEDERVVLKEYCNQTSVTHAQQTTVTLEYLFTAQTRLVSMGNEDSLTCPLSH